MAFMSKVFMVLEEKETNAFLFNMTPGDLDRPHV